MTIDRAKTIEMAHESGAVEFIGVATVQIHHQHSFVFTAEELERFAALVRAQVLLEVQQPVHVHSTSGDLGGSYDATALQAEIMNLPPEVDMCESGDFRAGYRAGHRDARYAAAELVASTGADTGRHGSDEHESGASAAVHRVKEQ